MGNRGRTSSAELSVISSREFVEIPRPRAPQDLTDEQGLEWRAIVGRLPADNFGRETHALLTAYCRHVVAQRRIAQLIQSQESENFDIAEYDRLLKMQERESRCLASLAVRLNIAQTTAYEKNKKPEGKAPWQYEG